jgi:adenylate cyclase, class 2
MKEIEAKILEIDRPALEARLRDIGAVWEFTAPFMAVYYDAPDGGLRARGEVLRLRKEGEEVALTFKRRLPSEDPQVKVREELEVKVSDYATACRIVEGLGYQAGLVMNKERTQYRIGEAHLVIDRYVDAFAHIPEFIEIEATSLATVHAVAAQLGFQPTQLLAWSAAELIAHYAGRAD